MSIQQCHYIYKYSSEQKIFQQQNSIGDDRLEGWTATVGKSADPRGGVRNKLGEKTNKLTNNNNARGRRPPMSPVVMLYILYGLYFVISAR